MKSFRTYCLNIFNDKSLALLVNICVKQICLRRGNHVRYSHGSVLTKSIVTRDFKKIIAQVFAILNKYNKVAIKSYLSLAQVFWRFTAFSS